MAKLNAKERNKLPSSSFGIPGERKYPMPDKSHAANAKARASQQEHAGRISKATEEKIDRKADRVLHKGHAPKKSHHDGHGHIGLMPGHDMAEDHPHHIDHKPAANAEHTKDHHNVVNPHSHAHKMKHG